MPKQPRDLAQLLIRKAEADLRSESLLLGGDDLVDPACFHIQQASEKLLKACASSETSFEDLNTSPRSVQDPVSGASDRPLVA